MQPWEWTVLCTLVLNILYLTIRYVKERCEIQRSFRKQEPTANIAESRV